MTQDSGRGDWRRRWLVVGLEREIKQNSLLPCHLRNHELVLWRSGDETVHAVEDRCLHRGTRLSAGFVRAGQLTCAYHGWRYDEDGHCAFFPALPDVTPPKNICLKKYPLVHSQGLMWTHLGNAKATKPPVLEGLDDSSRALVYAAPIFVGVPSDLLTGRLHRIVFPPSLALENGTDYAVKVRDAKMTAERPTGAYEATIKTPTETMQARFESTSPYPGVIRVTARAGSKATDTRLFAFVSPTDSAASLLHLVFAFPADKKVTYNRSAVDAFARYLRWSLENEDEGGRWPEQRPWLVHETEADVVSCSASRV